MARSGQTRNNPEVVIASQHELCGRPSTAMSAPGLEAIQPFKAIQDDLDYGSFANHRSLKRSFA
jgi:hypothetical protein